MPRELVEEGKCVCKLEPNCDHGLEGYNSGETYRYQKMKDSKGHYFRVWHSETYYETCPPGTFKKYFEVQDAKPGSQAE